MQMEVFMSLKIRCVSLLALLALLLSAASVLTACNNGSEPADTGTTAAATTPAETEGGEPTPEPIPDMTVKVTVLYHNGDAAENVVVSLRKDGKTVGDATLVNPRGVASITVPEGDYQIVLDTMGEEYDYDKAAAVVSADKQEATVVLYDPAYEGGEIRAHSDVRGAQVAYGVRRVVDGCMFVSISEGGVYEEIKRGEGDYYEEYTLFKPVGDGIVLDKTEMAYVAFVPTRGGVYEISCDSEDVSVAYYGNQFNVTYPTPITAAVDGKVTLEVEDGSVNAGDAGQTAQYIIGIKLTNQDTALTGCKLTIKRTGNVKQTIASLPWGEVQVDEAYVKPYSGVKSDTVVNIDVKSPVTVVFNSEDGYYHYGNENGPVVFIRLTTSPAYPDTFGSFKDIYEHQRIGAIVYDENGNFVKKIQYHEVLEAYMTLCENDANGACPLTPQLKEMVQVFGEYQGWWNMQSGSYIFNKVVAGEVVGPEYVNPETAWLFVCFYYA